MDFYYSNIKKNVRTQFLLFESIFIVRMDFIRMELFECLCRLSAYDIERLRTFFRTKN